MSMVKSKRQNKPGKKGVNGLSPTALTYNGPTRLPGDFGANDTTIIQFGTANSVASNGSGTLNAVFDAYSQASSSADWASAITMWAEYRIISYNVKLEPWNPYNQPTTNNLAPVFSVTERESTTALTTASQASSYASVQLHKPATPIERTIKMKSAEEAAWTQVTSSPATTARLYVKLLSLGNSNSLTLYDYLGVTLVQFRGRR